MQEQFRISIGKRVTTWNGSYHTEANEIWNTLAQQVMQTDEYRTIMKNRLPYAGSPVGQLLAKELESQNIKLDGLDLIFQNRESMTEFVLKYS